ncbi:MAG: NAD(+) diphosphatase [Steroidobacteraceae bacterium]|nr:NAD(+) diphosphatase [Steroidobacteraceae bacterium]
MRTPNVFAGPYLDRAAHLRKDASFVAAALADPGTLIAPLWQARNLLRRGERGSSAAFISVTHEIRRALPDGEFVLLGQFHGHAVFAAEVVAEAAPALLPDASFEDLRTAAGFLPQDEAGLLAYARAMILWRQRHRFCGSCGASARPETSGHVMRCTALSCGAEQFPRLDPAIIVLVTDGERALLGRQAAWPAGRYSTIAGFVEPGESLEDAVAREVLEETNVTVGEVEYHSSQPWPFPSSLMIGFSARAAADAVPRADEELEDVRWFTRAEIAAGTPGLPPPQSVSFRLIEDWYDSGSALPLRQTPGLKLWGRR